MPPGPKILTVLNDAGPIFDHTSVELLDPRFEETSRPKIDLADFELGAKVGHQMSKLSKDRISLVEPQYLDGRVLNRTGVPRNNRLCLGELLERTV